jgi:tungstate transport system ATP-binding protein
MSPCLALDDVHVRLGRAAQAALSGVTLRVQVGERVALVGANGSGKSTLLRVLMGLLPVQQGQIWRAPDLRVALVFQQPYLLRMSALHNVALALWWQGRPWRQARERAQQALHAVGLGGCAHRPARTLSGGQQQRLALARAWAQQPHVWLLDEPTASLDPHASAEVEALIRAFAAGAAPADLAPAAPGQQAAQGRTLVFSSHHLGQVRRLASRVVYLEAGRIRADVPVDVFFDAQRLGQHSREALAFLQAEMP